MFGKKIRVALMMGLLIAIVLFMCSCSGLIEVFVNISNEHTGTIFFSVYTSEGLGIKLYNGIPMQPGATTKVTLENAQGYYFHFSTSIGGLYYVWVEEIGGVETHDIPWVNSKTYHIGDLSIGEWQIIM